MEFGEAAYKDAIEKREISLQAKYPLAFILDLIIAAIVLLAGGFLTMTRHRKDCAENAQNSNANEAEA